MRLNTLKSKQWLCQSLFKIYFTHISFMVKNVYHYKIYEIWVLSHLVNNYFLLFLFIYLLFLKYELKNISFYRILRSQNIYHSISRILRSNEYLSFKFVRHFTFSLQIYGQKMSVIKNWNTTFVKFISTQ